LAAVTGPLLVAGVAWAQVGQKLCIQVSYGVSPALLKGMALQRSDANLGAGGLTPDQANELVNYAVADLCPNY
jgi:hypothetical protein